ncbi:GlxA family transcriptional regulator [Pseudoalteromonas luteoviolacea]|uniref:GlxA family transcriptional regulator n=1 Tax=Pseudoalteromonas luteoviolacea TaxID=43657 RepID=UPI00114E4067|nr:helix-turn-helix domain-containing protein [Pseudoalteromonas luteoviolacea]TQF67798.1 helix-turn-helix domain-containing protein [Pseudoalteromonas luteoviolacea]
MKKIHLTLINYPSASKAAVYGFTEIIEVTNSVCENLGISTLFSVYACKIEELNSTIETQVVILPPSTSDEFYTKKCLDLNDYLKAMQSKGATLASACVGSFILAHGGFLDDKFCTTHWRLAQQFTECFPRAKLNTNAIIINEGNVITAGGRMAWLDLAVEIISFYCPPTVVSTLSKEMVIDIGHREQKFYRQFIPKCDHGDEMILCVQKHLGEHYSKPTMIPVLAEQFYVSARTLQRRFQHAVGMSVIEYIQKIRLHNACQYLELSKKSVEEIAYAVGYQNVGALRKLFYREYGLSPTDYRKRFTA